MRMSEPPPIRSAEEGVNIDWAQDFPLNANGLNFPCQNNHRDAGHVAVKNWTSGEVVPITYFLLSSMTD
jgi:hypothetical protein